MSKVLISMLILSQSAVKAFKYMYMIWSLKYVNPLLIIIILIEESLENG